MKPGQVNPMAVFFKLAASSFINAAYYYGRARFSESETAWTGPVFLYFEDFLKFEALYTK